MNVQEGTGKYISSCARSTVCLTIHDHYYLRFSSITLCFTVDTQLCDSVILCATTRLPQGNK